MQHLSEAAMLGSSRGSIRTVGLLLAGVILGAGWQTRILAADAPAIPTTEISDVAVLPPPGPHRAYVGSGFQGGVHLVDGDTGKLEGQIYTPTASNFAINPATNQVVVAETFWSHGNRGTRTDQVSLYDHQLKLVAEVPVPGRLIAVPKSPTLAISADGRYAYVFNMQPATSVAVVDLPARKVAGVVEIPGCGLVYPFGASEFASLCADGTLALVTGAPGHYTVSHSARFFDAEADPVYEESLVDRGSGQALFLSYSGTVYPVTLGAKPVFSPPWSLLEAAGLRPASLATEEVAWRPGGSHLATYHKASGQLFVLMHAGVYWSHKNPGSEIWVFDVANHKRLRRIALPEPASSICVTQDAKPLLFVIPAEGEGPPGGMTVMDATSGEVKQQVKGVSGGLPATIGF